MIRRASQSEKSDKLPVSRNPSGVFFAPRLPVKFIKSSISPVQWVHPVREIGWKRDRFVLTFDTMAYTRDRYLKRQKSCLVLSVFLLIFGLLQLCLGILFSLKSRDRKCHKVKYMLIGVYLVIAGICGIANYCPRKTPSPCKAKKAIRSRGFTAVFVIFCTLVTVVVILDNSAFNCVSPHDTNSHEGKLTINNNT